MPNLLHLVQAVPLLIDNISKVMNKKEETKQKEIEETTERRKAELESSDKTSSQKTEVAIESMKTTGEVWVGTNRKEKKVIILHRGMLRGKRSGTGDLRGRLSGWTQHFSSFMCFYLTGFIKTQKIKSLKI